MTVTVSAKLGHLGNAGQKRQLGVMAASTAVIKRRSKKMEALAEEQTSSQAQLKQCGVDFGVFARVSA
jgi:hypothetical protein